MAEAEPEAEVQSEAGSAEETITETVVEETEEVVEDTEEELEKETKKLKKPAPSPPKKKPLKPPKKKKKKKQGAKGGKPKKAGKKRKESIVWARKRVAAIVPSFSPCPHIFFKEKIVDRKGLKPNEYINLLATPRKEPWRETYEIDEALYPFKRRPLTARTQCLAIPSKRYVTAILSEFFHILSDQQKNHLNQVLQKECDMTKETEEEEGNIAHSSKGGSRKAKSREDRKRNGKPGKGDRPQTAGGARRVAGKSGRGEKGTAGKSSSRGEGGIGESSKGREEGKSGQHLKTIDSFGGTSEYDANKWTEWLNKSLMVDENWAAWISSLVVGATREEAQREGIEISEESKPQLTNEDWEKYTVEIKKNLTDWQSRKKEILQNAEYWNDWQSGKPIPQIPAEVTDTGVEPSEINPSEWEEEIKTLVSDTFKEMGFVEIGDEAEAPTEKEKKR